MSRRQFGVIAALMLVLGSTVDAQEAVDQGIGVMLRGIDKVNAEVYDLEVANGAQIEFERLRVELAECRYPEGDPVRDAYAFLTIREQDNPSPIFEGWMMASSPALNALEHPRYDLWVLRCKTDVIEEANE